MTIELLAIHKSFGDFHALAGVDLAVKEGELVALLGPSGSGKTTLLRMIAGLDVPDSGKVLVHGIDTTHQHVRERKVGFVFQHYALFRHMTVFENVAFGLRVKPKRERLPYEQITERVMNLLRLVHLDNFYDRYPSQLSGGQRQRVALARALAVEPKLLLLDEPFGALDAKVRKELRRWLRRLHDELHITTIFVTHDQEEAMEVADRVVVMNAGKIEQTGTPEEVYHTPANGFVYDFLGNYNEFLGWKDASGATHLAEDDLWEAKTSSAPVAKEEGWLGGIRKWLPDALLPMPEITRKASARGKVRAALKERGVPVKMYARPHEMFVTKEPEGEHEYIPATVIHMNPAGSLAKLEMQRSNGSIIQAEVPKAIIDQLAISKHDRLYVRPKNVRVFE
jgi:sulfate transport system ATP-binding protein